MNRNTIIVSALVLILIAFGAGYAINHKSSSPRSNQANNTTTDGKSLDMSGQGLTSLANSVTDQTNVTSLNVSNNQLTTLPGSIANMKALETLNVENNRLENLPPEIGQMNKLVVLDISNNRLTSLPAELANLTQLRTLKLSGYKGSPSDIEQLKAKLPNTDIQT